MHYFSRVYFSRYFYSALRSRRLLRYRIEAQPVNVFFSDAYYSKKIFSLKSQNSHLISISTQRSQNYAIFLAFKLGEVGFDFSWAKYFDQNNFLSKFLSSYIKLRIKICFDLTFRNFFTAFKHKIKK